MASIRRIDPERQRGRHSAGRQPAEPQAARRDAARPGPAHGVRYEIRECIETQRGPRQHTLVSFRGVLTPEVLDRAEEKAQKPLEREALVARARAMGIPVTDRRRFPEARALLASLQRGGKLDPGLAGLLREALDPMRCEKPPSHLEEAAEWIGQSERERGRTLRGLTRAADRILRSRKPLRTRPRKAFPRFSSNPARPS